MELAASSSRTVSATDRLNLDGVSIGRLRERAKRDESDSGDGSGNVSGAGLDPTGSGHSSRRVLGLWLARPIESDSRKTLTFFFFFDSVGLWTASTSDGVVGLCPFRQRRIWTLNSVDFATAWTFSIEMSGSSCSASGATGPDHYSVFLLFHFPFEENHQNQNHSEPRERRSTAVDTTTTSRRTCSCMYSLLAEGVYAPFFWRHTRLRLVTSGLTSFLLVTSASRVTSVWLVLVSFRVFS